MNFPGKTQNNKTAIFLVGAIGGIGGSGLTVLWGVSAIWAALMLLLRKIPATLARSDLVLTGAATFYFVANLLSIVFNRVEQRDFFVVYPIIVFPLVWLIIPRLRLSKPEDLIGTVILGAGFCGLLALPVSVYQVIAFHMRAEGGAGNAIPFGLVCAIAGQLALLNTVFANKWRVVLGWLGYFAAFVCLLFSQTKGLFPPMLLGPVLLLVLFPKVRAHVFSRTGLVVLVVALICLALLAQPLYGRVLETLSFLFSGTRDESTSERLMLWGHAFDLIKQHPVLGYGMQNRYELIAETGRHYGHFHNGFITSAVDSGIVGLLSLIGLLAAPLVIAAKAVGSVLYRERLFLALVLTMTYSIGGMTNFIFWHDIYDNQFLWIAALIAASVPVGPSNPVAGQKKA